MEPTEPVDSVCNAERSVTQQQTNGTFMDGTQTWGRENDISNLKFRKKLRGL
jgi:hypothetical protein